MNTKRRNFVGAILEFERAGLIRLTRPARRSRRHSVGASRLVRRLPELANRARALGAFASAQRLDYYASRLAAAPNPAALRLVAAALAEDSAHAAAAAREDHSFHALRNVWRDAARMAAHPRARRPRRQARVRFGASRPAA